MVGSSTDKWIIEKRAIKSRNKFISPESHHKFVTVKHCDFLALGSHLLVSLLLCSPAVLCCARLHLVYIRPWAAWPVYPICLQGSEPSFIFLPTIHTDIYGHNNIYFKQCGWHGTIVASGGKASWSYYSWADNGLRGDDCVGSVERDQWLGDYFRFRRCWIDQIAVIHFIANKVIKP